MLSAVGTVMRTPYAAAANFIAARLSIRPLLENKAREELSHEPEHRIVNGTIRLELLRAFLPFQKAPAPNSTKARMIPAMTSSTVINVLRFIFRCRENICNPAWHLAALSGSDGRSSEAIGALLRTEAKQNRRLQLLESETDLPLAYSSTTSKRQMQTLPSQRMVGVPFMFWYFPVPAVIAPTEKPMTGANPNSSGMALALGRQWPCRR